MALRDIALGLDFSVVLSARQPDRNIPASSFSFDSSPASASASETRYVGEIGLDAGPRNYRSMPTQEAVFRMILEMCAARGGKILSIHSVRTASRVLDHIDECLPRDRGKVALHWFSGTAAEARRAVQAGCSFSVNHAMLEKPRGARSLLKCA